MPKDFFSPKKTRPSVSDIVPRPESVERAPKKEEKKQEPHPRQSASIFRVPKWPFILLLLIAIFGGLAYIALEILPKVEIKIFLKKYPLAFNEAVEVSKNISVNQRSNQRVSASTNESASIIKLPAELLTEPRNLQMSFPASGKQKIEKKAQGKITIYNGYSSDPQVLVADTRFLTPDNKIFRLTKAVTVPGAKIQEGKIVPLSIEASVIADQPGAEYNIGPVAKFTLPGFKGSPKYEGFYAKSDQPMANGFVGEKAVPTDQDIENAKARIKQALEDTLKIILFSQLPQDFKVIDGAYKFEILSEKVEKEVDKENKFSVFSEAQAKLIVFRENDLRDILISQLLAQLPSGDWEAIDFNREYGLPRSDFEKGEMSFPVKGQINFQRKIMPELFREEVRGKDEQTLKALVFSLPGLEKAQISFWPIYVKKVPTNINKIKITIE